MSQTLQTDQLLLGAYAQTGDAGAFAELVKRYADMVYATARRVTGDAAAAEDVAQDCFLRLAQRSATISGSVPAWLHRTSVNRALELARADRSRRLREAKVAARERIAGAAGNEDSAQLIARVDEALAALPEDLRLVITEHFLCGQTQADLAARFGVNQSTVQRRIDKALTELRRRLRADRDESPAAATGFALLLAGFRDWHAPDALRQSLTKIGLSGVRNSAIAVGATVAGGKLAAWKLVAALVLAATGTATLYKAIRPSSSPSGNATSLLTLDQLPAVVRTSLEGQTPLSAVREIERSRDGTKIVYDIDFAVGDRMFEVRLAENGDFIWRKPSS